MIMRGPHIIITVRISVRAAQAGPATCLARCTTAATPSWQLYLRSVGLIPLASRASSRAPAAFKSLAMSERPASYAHQSGPRPSAERICALAGSCESHFFTPAVSPSWMSFHIFVVSGVLAHFLAIVFLMECCPAARGCPWLPPPPAMRAMYSFWYFSLLALVAASLLLLKSSSWEKSFRFSMRPLIAGGY